MAPAAAEEALDLDRCLSAALEVATAAGDIIAEVGTDVACRVGGRPALLCAVASARARARRRAGLQGGVSEARGASFGGCVWLCASGAVAGQLGRA